MGRWTVATCGMVVAALLAGCGASGPHGTPPTSSVVTTTPASSAVSDPAVTHRLLTAGEMPAGFSASGAPSVATSIEQWLSANLLPAVQVAAETARYKRIGFVAGATLNLNSAHGAGVSVVEQFRSPAGASSELAYGVSSFRSAGSGQRGFRVVSFKVPGIPGAVGFGGNQPDTGSNVAFADGDYYYLVGEQPSAPANRAAVIASAQKLYRRVHG